MSFDQDDQLCTPCRADALREAANEIDQQLADAPNPSPDMRLWHGIFADFLRVKALEVEPMGETVTFPVRECGGWGGGVVHAEHIYDWADDGVIRYCKGE